MKFNSRIFLPFFLLVAAVLIGCGGKEEVKEEVAEAPKPFDPMALELTDANLIKGREVWMSTCAGCHISGLGGAPKISDQAAWAPRVAQGKETLYDHAINGFTGPQLNEMPPKGGFPNLSDDDVKVAVDFVVYAVSQ